MQRNKNNKANDWSKMPFKALKNDDEFDKKVLSLYNNAKPKS